MTQPLIEAYLTQLRMELRKRFAADDRIVAEVRDHLVERSDQIRRESGTAADADAEAIRRFGAPETVAAACADDSTRMLHRLVLVGSALAGLGIAYVDSRPNWDDTGITAGALVLGAAVCGLLGPRRPWLWALAMGIWIPGHAFLRTPTAATLPFLLILMFPLTGAYMGYLVRRIAAAIG